MCYSKHCIIRLKDSGTSSIRWNGLFRLKWIDGASSVRLSSVSRLLESGQILRGHLGENNLLTMLSLSVCLPAENKMTDSFNFTGC